MNWPHLKANWKTTVQPILNMILVLGVDSVIPGSPIHSVKVLWYIGLAAGLAKIYLGAFQVDAGVVPVVAPDGSVKVADSHEVPNDPKVTPLTK
ncbi:MAG: hypothetical protein ACRYGG_11875 [Janthinobacterium lividum]